MSVTNRAAISVLLVEDDPVDIELARKALSQVVHPVLDVQCARQLLQALELLRTETFDVVLLDLGLPQYCGLESLKAMRAANHQIPIVVLTSLDDEQAALEAIELGVQDYVVKNKISADSLSRIIRYAIQRKQFEKALEESVELANLTASIGVILTRREDLRGTLQELTEALVSHLDVALARIWTLNSQDNVLELQASAGMYTHLNDPHSRVPVGQLKIGQIAERREPHLTNEVIGDPRVGDQEWAKREGLVAFAGYPLVCQDRLVGVVAMFARRKLSNATLKAIEAVADGIAIGIESCRAAERLRASEDRFECAVRGSTDGLWDWNIETDDSYLSPRLKEMLGFRDDELENTFSAWKSRLHPEDRDLVLDLVRRHLEHRTPYQIEHRMQTKNGEYRWFYARGQALWNAEGKAYRMAGSETDITERKQMEAALAQRDEQSRQSQRLEAMGALSGGIAHEFNNLLQAICGYTRFALVGLSPDEQRCQDLQIVLESADRAATLTKQLLSFGRRQVLQRTDVDLNQVVTELTKMLRALIGENIEVRTHLTPGIGAIHADAGQLQQALLNLCINARDAMPDGGRLVIRTRNIYLSEGIRQSHPSASPGPHVLLTVADTGCGMSPEVKEHIFEPFYTTKELGKGTGLGLAMVYGMVEQHGGAIHVYSEPGSGTTFKIYLPVKTADKTTSSTVVGPELAYGCETILVAEDEPMARGFVVRVLQGAGYKTLTAIDGADALRVFTENADTVALALLDVVMPQIGGRSVCQKIMNIRPDIRVIFCTGHDPEINQAEMSEQQGLPFLQKPVDPALLLQTVRAVLDAPASRGGPTVPRAPTIAVGDQLAPVSTR